MQLSWENEEFTSKKEGVGGLLNQASRVTA